MFAAAAVCLVGLFSLVCAVKNYDWFMERHKGKTMMAIMLGPNGVRAFYIILGIALVALGIVFFIHPPAGLP